ncbi:MAG: hypothetical protein ACYT04_61295 [Nostoc sp.]
MRNRSTWAKPRRSMTRYRFAIAFSVSPWEKTAFLAKSPDALYETLKANADSLPLLYETLRERLHKT